MSNFVIKCLIIGFFSLSAIATVLTIGNERKPTSPGMALAILICTGLIIWGVASL